MKLNATDRTDTTAALGNFRTVQINFQRINPDVQAILPPLGSDLTEGKLCRPICSLIFKSYAVDVRLTMITLLQNPY